MSITSGLGVAKAQVFGRNAKLSDGFEGTVKITRTFEHDGRRFGAAYIAEFDVMSTNQPDRDPVGSRRSWRQSLGQKDIAASSLKAFAAAMSGLSTSDEDEINQASEDLDAAVCASVEYEDDEDKNYFIGTVVGVNVEEIKTQTGQSFKRHTWWPVR